MTLLLVLDAPVKLEPAHVETDEDTLVVTVTHRHIELARQTISDGLRSRNCPIALAGAEALGRECAMGYELYVYDSDGSHVRYFSDGAGVWARNFDVDPSSVSPTTFTFTRAA